MMQSGSILLYFRMSYQYYMREKKLIVFDLDGTLAESKTVMDAEMATLVRKLLTIKKVAVMSGGRFEQFKIEFLGSLHGSETLLRSLYLFPTCATSFYRYEKEWVHVYHEKFSEHEKGKILLAFKQIMEKNVVFQPTTLFGDVLEDRDSQITYSAAGQKAPVEVKRAWDSDAKKRLVMKKMLDDLLPEFEVRIGGMTSIDVTRKGIDKGYGIWQIERVLKIPRNRMLFIGDALFPGGNDFPVKVAGVECIPVQGPEDTKKILRNMLHTNTRMVTA